MNRLQKAFSKIKSKMNQKTVLPSDDLTTIDDKKILENIDKDISDEITDNLVSPTMENSETNAAEVSNLPDDKENAIVSDTKDHSTDKEEIIKNHDYKKPFAVVTSSNDKLVCNKSKCPYIVKYLLVSCVKENYKILERTFSLQDAIDAIIDSVKEKGILNPISVTPSEDGFDLIAGMARLAVARILNIEMIPAKIFDVDSFEEMKSINIEDNKATPPHFLERIRYQANLKKSVAEIAKIYHLSETKIRKDLQTLKISEEEGFLYFLDQGISWSILQEICCTITINEKRFELLQKCQKYNWSVRKLQTEIEKLQKQDPEKPKKVKKFSKRDFTKLKKLSEDIRNGDEKWKESFYKSSEFKFLLEDFKRFTLNQSQNSQ